MNRGVTNEDECVAQSLGNVAEALIHLAKVVACASAEVLTLLKHEDSEIAANGDDGTKILRGGRKRSAIGASLVRAVGVIFQVILMSILDEQRVSRCPAHNPQKDRPLMTNPEIWAG